MTVKLLHSGDAAAGLSTITPTALDRGPVFETVPELREFGSNACDRYKALLTGGKKINDPLCRWHTTLSI